MIIPVYTAEISPKELRGKVGSFIGPVFSIGYLLSALINVGVAQFFSGWRVSYGFQGALGVAFAFGMCFMPHTPRYV